MYKNKVFAMKRVHRPFILVIFLLIANVMTAQDKTAFRYETVPGDPLKARIYTLGNGMKVFMSVYKDAPRIQTYIGVRVGSKNDPPETTGLAHYFEHMMFKGTETYGTTDWDRERVLIGQIDGLFEVYRKENDDAKRAAIYREIDSLSYEASKIAISNEYDKLMDAIGSQGSNAGTSNDYTIYMENIPANQVDNWARIEADRFSKPVLRLFHTEVETVFEEKNRSLTSDSRKVSETTLKLLFPNHPYGRQTTLGEAEHLKNPSMKNIREFFARYYVPNNMALCMAGDFNPDSVIRIIDKNFGKLTPGTVPELTYDAYVPLGQPAVDTITGLEAESVRISWGFNAPADSHDALVLRMIGTMLYNGKAGLIDLNINQEQLTLSANSYPAIMNDYSYLTLSGRPKGGQSLEEVKELLIGQIDKLKTGEFPDWMIEAAVNNFRFSQIRQYESNQGRAMAMSNAFLSGIPYEQSVKFLDEISGISKDEIVAFANRYIGDNYALVYKRQGPPEDVRKIVKPPITPISMNYADESAFLKEIKDKKVKPIEPVFLDYEKDVAKRELPGGIRLLYARNTEDDVFTLTYYFKTGKNSDKELQFALNLLPYLGTSKHTAAEIKQEFYRIACDLDISSRDEESTITISGLSTGFDRSLELLEELLNDCKPDQDALASLVNNTLKSRKDQKSSQQEVFNALISYGAYGADSPYKNILSEAVLNTLSAENLAGRIRSLCGFRHEILYYGPLKEDKVASVLKNGHRVAEQLKELPALMVYMEKPTDTDQVLFVHYDAKQTRLQTIIREFRYDPNLAPDISLFDYYMGNLSFQELREKRALAYTAYARFQSPPDLRRYYLAIGFIGTQNDKMIEAFKALNTLYDDMPLSETGFKAAQDAVISKIRSERITRMSILWNYIDAEKKGLKSDIRRNIYLNVQNMTSKDIAAFNANYLKSKTKTYLVLGKESELDFEGLSKIGPVTKLTLEEIFGY
jgi:predicted Zn-dependent peptidase